MLINEEVAEAFVKEVSETSDGQRLNDTFSDSLTKPFLIYIFFHA
jgi:hypothetical protein